MLVNQCKVQHRSVLLNHLCPLTTSKAIFTIVMTWKGRETKSDSERVRENENYYPGLSVQTIFGEALIVYCQ